MADRVGPVSIEEGFYPRFSDAFLDHYGADSAFVRATADAFTRSLARLLASTGRLAEGTAVPMMASDGAVDALLDLLEEMKDRRAALLQEACGAGPIGAFGAAVDDRLGPGAFDRWVAGLEAIDAAG